MASQPTLDFPFYLSLAEGKLSAIVRERGEGPNEIAPGAQSHLVVYSLLPEKDMLCALCTLVYPGGAVRCIMKTFIPIIVIILFCRLRSSSCGCESGILRNVY